MDSLKGHSCPIREEEKDGFSDRLRTIMMGASTRSFAKKLGFAEATVRKLLKGGLPRLDNLIVISNVTNVTVEWLATGRGNKTYNESEHNTNTSQQAEQPQSVLVADIGKSMKKSRTDFEKAVHIADYQPNTIISEFMKTSMFYSEVAQKMDVDTVASFISMLKELEQKE